MIRRVVGLAFGVLLVLGGAWLIYEEIFASIAVQFRMVAAAAFMLLIGGYVCWSILGEFRKAR